MAAISDERRALARRLRARGMFYKDVGAALGVSASQAERIVSGRNGHEAGRTYRERVTDKVDGRIRADAERLLRRVPEDTRSLTARVMGDPLPGRGAGA